MVREQAEVGKRKETMIGPFVTLAGQAEIERKFPKQQPWKGTGPVRYKYPMHIPSEFRRPLQPKLNVLEHPRPWRGPTTPVPHPEDAFMDWGPYDELEEDQPPPAQSENTVKQATGVSRTTSTPKPRPKPLRRHELNGASEEHASRHASGGGMGGGPRVLEVHRQARSVSQNKARVYQQIMKKQQSDEMRWEWVWDHECWDWELEDAIERSLGAELNASAAEDDGEQVEDPNRRNPDRWNYHLPKPIFKAGKCWSYSDAPLLKKPRSRPSTAMSGAFDAMWAAVPEEQMSGSIKKLANSAARSTGLRGAASSKLPKRPVSQQTPKRQLPPAQPAVQRPSTSPAAPSSEPAVFLTECSVSEADNTVAEIMGHGDVLRPSTSPEGTKPKLGRLLKGQRPASSVSCRLAKGLRRPRPSTGQAGLRPSSRAFRPKEFRRHVAHGEHARQGVASAGGTPASSGALEVSRDSMEPYTYEYDGPEPKTGGFALKDSSCSVSELATSAIERPGTGTPQLPSQSQLLPDRTYEVWPARRTGLLANCGTAPEVSGDKSCKPKLLLEMETFIAGESEGPRKMFEKGTSFQVKESCFQMFIEGVYTFGELFAKVKSEYRTRFDELEEEIEARKAKIEELRAGEVTVQVSQMSGEEEMLKVKNQVEAAEADMQAAEEEYCQEEKELARVEACIRQAEVEIKAMNVSNLDICRQLNAMDSSKLQQIKKDWGQERDMLIKQILEMQEEKVRYLKAAEDRSDRRDDMNTEVNEANDVRHNKFLHKSEPDASHLCKKYRLSIEDLQMHIGGLEEKLGNLTPRPASGGRLWSDEDTCVNKLKSLMQEFSQASKELMSVKEELPPELMSDSEDEDTADWVLQTSFSGQGEGEEVPRYLRLEASKSVENMKLSKGATEGYIKNFWRERRRYDNEKDKKKFPALNIDDWMYYWLEKKFAPGKDKMPIIQWGYNLLDAALHYKYDADCELWLRVMQGEYDEAIYWDEYNMVDGFMMLLQKLDKQANGGRVTGKLRKDMLLKACRKYFPLKTDIRFNRLKRALGKDPASGDGSNFAAYIHLFAEDKDGNQGPFAEGIRDQHVEEREEYLADIEMAIAERQHRSGPSETGEGEDVGFVYCKNCISAFEEVDPKKPPEKIEAYVKRGFGIKSKGKLDLEAEISVNKFMDKLSVGVVATSTKRDARTIEDNDAEDDT